MLRRNMQKLGLLFALAALGFATLGVVGASTDAKFWEHPERNNVRNISLKFDVAEDMTRFAFDPDHTFEEDGFPAHGSFFVTQGYIYPEGTLDGTNGVNPDGTPEFPDQVIGSWTCYGTFIGDAAHATSGPWVVTTQIYNFGSSLGNQTLVTDGFELADVGVPIERAITGGTGDFANARGEGEQTFLGFNANEGVSLSVELDVKMR